MRTYPEMDKEIIKLLDMEGMPLSVYAARVIENLQAENAELRHCAEVAEKMFDILYEETSEYMKVLSKEWYKHHAEKELAEGKKDDGSRRV